jgi:hypothetical protein
MTLMLRLVLRSGSVNLIVRSGLRQVVGLVFVVVPIDLVDDLDLQRELILNPLSFLILLVSIKSFRVTQK